MTEANQDLYKLIIDTANEGIWAIDSSRLTTFVNEKMAGILGYPREEILGRSLMSFMDDEGVALIKENVRRRENNEEALKQFKLIHRDGSPIWVFANVSRIIQDGKDIGALGMLTDITKEYYEHQLQKESYQSYISLFEDSPVPIWYEDFSQIKLELDKLRSSGTKDIRHYFEKNPEEITRVSSFLKVIDINKAVVELNDAESKEQVLMNYKNLLTRRSSEYAVKQFEAIWEGLPNCQFDAELKTFKGNIRYVNFKWNVVKGHEEDYKRVHLTTTDLTERIIDENLTLQNSNREKVILLKEVHHRVKNNLQIVTSLLNLQSGAIEDERTRDLFEMSLSRIQSMATVHELLYRSSNFSKIDYFEYLKTLIHPLIVSMKGVENNIQFELEVAGIELNINTAIPLGLLINEILMNALKHGIVDDAEGQIYVRINTSGDQKYMLSIGDNGKGFSYEQSLEDSDTLGLQLISSLTDQLSGTIVRDSEKAGTHYQISFEEIP